MLNVSACSKGFGWCRWVVCVKVTSTRTPEEKASQQNVDQNITPACLILIMHQGSYTHMLIPMIVKKTWFFWPNHLLALLHNPFPTLMCPFYERDRLPSRGHCIKRLIVNSSLYFNSGSECNLLQLCTELYTHWCIFSC